MSTQVTENLQVSTAAATASAPLTGVDSLSQPASDIQTQTKTGDAHHVHTHRVGQGAHHNANSHIQTNASKQDVSEDLDVSKLTLNEKLALEARVELEGGPIAQDLYQSHPHPHSHSPHFKNHESASKAEEFSITSLSKNEILALEARTELEGGPFAVDLKQTSTSDRAHGRGHHTRAAGNDVSEDLSNAGLSLNDKLALEARAELEGLGIAKDLHQSHPHPHNHGHGHHAHQLKGRPEDFSSDLTKNEAEALKAREDLENLQANVTGDNDDAIVATTQS